MKIFMKNKARIAEHNAQYHKGHHSYMLKMNHFGDLLPHESHGMMNGYRFDLKQNGTGNLLGTTFITPTNMELPKSVDWRTQGNMNRYLGIYLFCKSTLTTLSNASPMLPEF